MATLHSHILLRDKSRHYPREMLLESNKDGSYRKHAHDGGIYIGHLRCDNDGDVAPLGVVECCILDALHSDADRYEVCSTPGKLKWGRSLKVGDSVLARLPGSSGQQHQYTTAIIRWCGGIMGMGHKFGVEIMVSSYVYIPSCIEIV